MTSSRKRSRNTVSIPSGRIPGRSDVYEDTARSRVPRTTTTGLAMAAATDVKVPDIGDFKDVRVIEVLIKPGDTVKAEDSLVTLESDKATMDVPSPVAGVVKEVNVKLGDKVSEGSLVLVLDAAQAAEPAAPP